MFLMSTGSIQRDELDDGVFIYIYIYIYINIHKKKDPKLDLESTYAYVRREHQQKQTMGGSHHISESSAMLANQTRQGPSLGSSKTRNNQPPGNSSGFVCSHCGEIGHSKQR